jgi:hypothetical protein
MPGTRLAVTTPDTALNEVQVIGLSRTTVATNNQITLYVRIATAAAVLGVNIVKRVETAMSLSSIMKYQQRHLYLLRNLSNIINDRLRIDSNETKLDIKFKSQTYDVEGKAADIFTFIKHIAEQVSSATTTSVITDDNLRMAGINAALTQANEHLEAKENESMRKNPYIAATLVAALSSTLSFGSGHLGDDDGEPGAGAPMTHLSSQGAEGKGLRFQDETERLIKTFPTDGGKDAAVLMFNHIALAANGDLDEMHTYGQLLASTPEGSAVRTAVMEGKTRGILMAIAQAEHFLYFQKIPSPYVIFIKLAPVTGATASPTPPKSTMDDGYTKRNATGSALDLEHQRIALQYKQLQFERDQFEFKQRQDLAAAEERSRKEEAERKDKEARDAEKRRLAEADAERIRNQTRDSSVLSATSTGGFAFRPLNLFRKGKHK